MLESVIRNQLSTRVSLLTHKMVGEGAKEKTSVPFEAGVSFDFSHRPSARFGWHRGLGRHGNCQHQASSGSLRLSCLSVSCSFKNRVLVQHHQLRYWIWRTFSLSDAHAVCFSRCCRAGFKADNDVCFIPKELDTHCGVFTKPLLLLVTA